MRRDMQKVIVESARCHGDRTVHRPRRTGDDFENFPTREGMKRQWQEHKHQTDLLGPIYGYLDKQARLGRPWNKVWSEISEHLDFRSVLGFHIKTHIDQYVARDVHIINGKPYEPASWRRSYHPECVYYRRGWWAPKYNDLYVDPRTGILRAAPKRSYKWKPTPNPGIKVISEFVQLHRIDGVWYMVELRPRPVIHGHMVSQTRFGDRREESVAMVPITRDALGLSDDSAAKVYGRKDVYAVSKRQLSKKEKKAHNL